MAGPARIVRGTDQLLYELAICDIRRADLMEMATKVPLNDGQRLMLEKDEAAAGILRLKIRTARSRSK